ncbi:MAG TPA: hypothetical protein VK507_21105 [Iamia sp.]|nr:hypothetical protein [Iamia sp.]
MKPPSAKHPATKKQPATTKQPAKTQPAKSSKATHHSGKPPALMRDGITLVPTHAVLHDRFAKIGAAFVTQPVGKSKVVGQLKGLKAFPAKRLSSGGMSPAAFAAAYRRDLPGQDELLSTASIVHMRRGVHEAQKGTILGAAKQKEMRNAFQTASNFRLPTEMVGVATGGTRRGVQHPTAPAKAMFRRSGENHGDHDRRRRAEAADAAEAATKKPGWTVQKVMHASLVAAIGYTLNNMAAPPTAKNVRPHMRRQVAAEIKAAHVEREHLKRTLVTLGGLQEAPDAAKGGAAFDRRWTDRTGLRSASPPRVRP